MRQDPWSFETDVQEVGEAEESTSTSSSKRKLSSAASVHDGNEKEEANVHHRVKPRRYFVSLRVNKMYHEGNPHSKTGIFYDHRWIFWILRKLGLPREIVRLVLGISFTWCIMPDNRFHRIMQPNAFHFQHEQSLFETDKSLALQRAEDQDIGFLRRGSKNDRRTDLNFMLKLTTNQKEPQRED